MEWLEWTFRFFFPVHVSSQMCYCNELLYPAVCLHCRGQQRAKHPQQSWRFQFPFGNAVSSMLAFFLLSLLWSDFMLHEPANSRQSEWRCHLGEMLGLACSFTLERLTNAASSCSTAAKILNRRPQKLKIIIDLGIFQLEIPAVTFKVLFKVNQRCSISMFRLVLKTVFCTSNMKTMKQGLRSINTMTIDSNLSHVICRPVKPPQLATANIPRFLSHAHYRRPQWSCCWLIWSTMPGLLEGFNSIKYGVSSDI